MRLMTLVWLVSTLTLTACTATVQTYDAGDKLIGSCTAHRWIMGPAVTCSGRANGESAK